MGGGRLLAREGGSPLCLRVLVIGINLNLDFGPEPRQGNINTIITILLLLWLYHRNIDKALVDLISTISQWSWCRKIANEVLIESADIKRCVSEGQAGGKMPLKNAGLSVSDEHWFISAMHFWLRKEKWAIWTFYYVACSLMWCKNEEGRTF